MPLFTYLRTQKAVSLFDFKGAAQSLPRPRERLCQELDDRLHHARGSQNRLAAFYLYKLPAEFDISWKAQAVASGAKEWLCGDWMANLIDQQPWLLEEVLPTQPSLIPNITRVWYGSIRSGSIRSGSIRHVSIRYGSVR